MNIPNNENHNICAECGGCCCKRYGGAYHPEDFDCEITVESVEKLLDTGKVSIDWYEIDNGGRGYFLRSRHANGGKVDPSWGDRCVNLTDTGCSLEFDKRPFGCRSLIPEKNERGECTKGAVGKEESYIIWKPYQDVLSVVCDKYNGTDDFRVSGEIDPFTTLLGSIIDNWDFAERVVVMHAEPETASET